MCLAHPGPRCSSHCMENLVKARRAYYDAVGKIETDPNQKAAFDAAKARYERAQARYDRSPEGQRSLLAEADAIRSTDPKRAAALEALAGDAERTHSYEVNAYKQQKNLEEKTFESLHAEAFRANAAAQKIADNIAKGAPGADRAKLTELRAKVRSLASQYSTTTKGLNLLRSNVAETRARLEAVPDGDEHNDEYNRIFDQVERAEARLKASESARARMLSQYAAKKSARQQADALMAEARANGGIPVLEEKKPKPVAQPVAQPTPEAVSTPAATASSASTQSATSKTPARGAARRGKGDGFPAKYDGKDAITGETFPAGTLVTRNPDGKGWVDVSRGCANCSQPVSFAEVRRDSSGIRGVIGKCCRYESGYELSFA